MERRSGELVRVFLAHIEEYRNVEALTRRMVPR
jgi:hypothetical protein